MSFKGKIREYLFNKIVNNRKLKSGYLRLAVFFSTHGIAPPFSLSFDNSTRRWELIGIVESSTKPENYVKEDASIPELFSEVLPYLENGDSILEIGCNAGRSLQYLYSRGFTHLTGVEISPKAVELMKDVYPEVFDRSRIIIGNAPDIIKRFGEGEFVLVFCHSVLVNIHPAYNYLFKEMARVSSRFIVIMENEGSLGVYPRDFKKMFERYGFKMIVSKVFHGRFSLAVPFGEEDNYFNNTLRIFVKKSG